MQLFVQMINLQPKIPRFLLMRNMAPSSWMTPFSVVYKLRFHSNTRCGIVLPIPPSLQINEVILTLRTNKFFPIML